MCIGEGCESLHPSPMALGVETPRSPYVGNGSTTVFPISFTYSNSSDVEVYLDDVLQSSGFTVNAADVTFTTAPATGVTVTLLRNTPLDQPAPFSDPQKLTLAEIEKTADRTVMQLQDRENKFSRVPLLPPSTTVANRANTTSAFNENGVAIAETPAQTILRLGSAIDPSATAAAQSAVASKDSKLGAETAAGNAANSAANASTSEGNAANSATNAANSEQNASDHEANANTAKQGAEAAKDAAEAALTALQNANAAGREGYLTKAAMDADLAHSEGTVAEVVADPTPANNGTYGKIGASGSGSWTPSTSDESGRLTNAEAKIDLDSRASDEIYHNYVENGDIHSGDPLVRHAQSVVDVSFQDLLDRGISRALQLNNQKEFVKADVGSDSNGKWFVGIALWYSENPANLSLQGSMFTENLGGGGLTSMLSGRTYN